jgi:hypothetical protein
MAGRRVDLYNKNNKLGFGSFVAMVAAGVVVMVVAAKMGTIITIVATIRVTAP